MPWCIYCQPEVAFAGHSEESAKEAGYDVVASKHQYRGNSRALIIGDQRGPGEGHRREDARRPGGHASSASTWSARGSPSSSGQGYLAVNWEATVDEVAAFIQPHPTLSELFGETVRTSPGRLH